MKHLGSIMEFRHQRDSEIIRVFRSLAAESPGNIVTRELFDKVVRMPASRFWVSEERATAVISAIEAGRPLSGMRPNKVSMFREIHRRYLKLREQHPDTPLPVLVEQVVHQPAPCFYLTPQSALKYFFKHRSLCRRESRTALQKHCR